MLSREYLLGMLANSFGLIVWNYQQSSRDSSSTDAKGENGMIVNIDVNSYKLLTAMGRILDGEFNLLLMIVNNDGE